MDEGSSQDEVTIFDKDESAEHAINIVGGFVIEESQKPFPVSWGREGGREGG